MTLWERGLVHVTVYKDGTVVIEDDEQVFPEGCVYLTKEAAKEMAKAILEKIDHAKDKNG